MAQGRWYKLSAGDLPRHIFRAYDIRGTIGDEITPERVRLIAQVFATRFFNPSPKLVLGRDLRESSKALAEAAMDGLLAAGAEVWDVGVAPSPLVYFAIGRWGADGGLVITASHLPPDHNGLKLRLGDGPFYGDSLQELYKAALEPPQVRGGGRLVARDVYAEYFPAALTYLKLHRPVRLVLDLGNGAGCLTAPALFERLGCKPEILFGEPDGGRFKGRGPDPLAEGALRALCERVVQSGAEAGLAIDADGDRLAVVDEKGSPISADRALLPLIREALAQGEKHFVSDVRCSRSTIRYIEERGGHLAMAKCGYPFILDKMRKLSAAIGFETTGHYYFRNPDIKFDDAVFAAALLVGALSRSQEPLSQIIASAPLFCTSDELRWHCDDAVKFKVVERLTEEYAREFEVIIEDGVRVEKPEGWALVRASNTAPEITMRWEGDSPESRDAIGQELQQRVRRVMDEVARNPQTTEH